MGADQAFLFELAERDRDAWPPDAKHRGKELVRQPDIIALGTIMGHQQPAGEPLVELAAAVGQSRLRHLEQECVHISQ